MHQKSLKTFLFFCLFISFLIVIPFSLQAAVVVLKNGDRITGLIVKMQDKKLEMETEYSSANFTIDWEDVRSITADRPMSIKLYGEADLPENVGQRVGDRIISYTLEEGGPIRLEDVRGINLTEHDYRGFISAGGNQTSGNTQVQAINLSGNLTYRKEEHRFFADGRYNRAQASGEDTANNGALNLKYEYFLTRRFYLAGINLSETDQFQDLSLRETAGIGPGYDILDSKQQLLSIMAGPTVVYQDFTTTPATVTPSTTWALRSEFRFRGDDVILFHKHQGFEDLGHGWATRVNAEQGIRVKIAENWRINFEFDLRYNSLPVAGRKTTDTNIIFGFSYELKP
jgi:putative salt-induced outer membrane protein YdiY